MGKRNKNINIQMYEGAVTLQKTVQQLRAEIHDRQRCIDLANTFYTDVLPQIGKLCIQDYAALNELGILLNKYKTKGEPR